MEMDGSCKYCAKPVSQKDGMEHFLSCHSRIQVFKKNQQKLVNDWFYIQAESSPYWIDILIPKKWKLDDIDHFLREIWLECCGHLSHFRINQIIYEQFRDEDWLIDGEELSPGMDISLNKVLEVGREFSHIYDYGSTTKLKLKVLNELQFPVKKQLFLCARNHLPIFKCAKCKNKASRICTLCQDFSCGKCSELKFQTFADDCEHIFSPLVNSPRTGVCGYDGSA